MPVDPWELHRRPHCWPVGAQCPNPCARAHYDHVVHNHVQLAGPWAGWRLAGRWLVGPGNSRSAPRITVERLQGLIWAEASRMRAEAARSRKSGLRGQIVALTLRR